MNEFLQLFAMQNATYLNACKGKWTALANCNPKVLTNANKTSSRTSSSSNIITKPTMRNHYIAPIYSSLKNDKKQLENFLPVDICTF